MAKITHIIIHCSDSLWGCAREIRAWHTLPKPEGRGWKDIGYHFVIQNGRPISGDLYVYALNGQIECGRRLDGGGTIEGDEIGTHCLGYNERSIGICMVGKSRNGIPVFTLKQFDALKELLFELCKLFKIPVVNVLGHCETESGKAEGKTCPDFDVAAIRTWLQGRVR